jgi:hypothetical protein
MEFFLLLHLKFLENRYENESSFACYKKAEIFERDQGLFNDCFGYDYVWHRMDRISVAE